MERKMMTERKMKSMWTVSIRDGGKLGPPSDRRFSPTVAREEKQAEEAEVPAAAAVVGEDSGGERAVLYNDTSPANIAVASKLEHWRVS